MKKYFYVALFLVLIGNIALVGNPYLQRNNVIYGVLQPGDMGLGLRYDRHFGIGGVYASLAKGAYRLPFGGYINDHYKGAVGLMWQFPQKFNNYIKDYLSLGVTYHTYGGRSYRQGIINENVFKPWSFEAGVAVKIKRFAVGIRMDALKWEGSMDFGWVF